MKRLFAMAASVAALAAIPAAAQDFTVVGATVAMGDGSEPIDNGTVVVASGRIVYAGPAAGAPATSGTVMDAQGGWVTPGIFASLTDLGLFDVGAVSQSNDTSAGNSPFSAALDYSTSVNPAATQIGVSRAGGVTRASVIGNARGSIFAGQGAVIDLGADPDAVVAPRAFQFVELGERGGALAGGSRVATHVTVRNALAEARAYAAGRRDGADAMLTRADAEALGPVVRGEQKLYIRAERAADLRAVLAFRREFPALDIVIVGASEGWLVAGEIAAAGVPVIADPLDDLPSSFEQLAATQDNVGRMVDAGVSVAVGSYAGMEQPRYAPQYAGNLVSLTRVPNRTGLTWGEALASITSVPATIAGVGGRYGVLAPGAVADIVIWDGDPLELASAPIQVFIDGVEQPLTNHQTRLRDRYRDLDESDLPKAYDR